MSAGDILDEQEFHELCMDYRGATPGNAQAAYARIQNFILHHFTAKHHPTESAGERSATPLVDEMAFDLHVDGYDWNSAGEYVLAENARTLERDLTAARQRIEGLEAELVKAHTGHRDTTANLHIMTARATAAESRLAAVEAKAARYDWLLAHESIFYLDEYVTFTPTLAEQPIHTRSVNRHELDRAIDSAIRHLKEKA